MRFRDVADESRHPMMGAAKASAFPAAYKPIERSHQAGGVRADDQLRRAAPAQMDHVNAAVVGAHVVGARVGLVPFDDDDSVFQGPPLTVISRRSK